MKRPLHGDIAIAVVAAVAAAFQILIAYSASVSEEISDPTVIAVAWSHAVISVLLIGVALYLRTNPLFCASVTLVLLGVCGLRRR